MVLNKARSTHQNQNIASSSLEDMEPVFHKALIGEYFSYKEAVHKDAIVIS